MVEIYVITAVWVSFHCIFYNIPMQFFFLQRCIDHCPILFELFMKCDHTLRICHSLYWIFSDRNFFSHIHTKTILTLKVTNHIFFNLDILQCLKPMVHIICFIVYMHASVCVCSKTIHVYEKLVSAFY